ncbi:MAG TPA: tetratricopeptide repeat protein [Anaerolineaceae bacterium]|nr:tetratricopeptide repeat protein [Anaerolineaceae bacterium]HPN51814.1 tetratricopeptide repeat protein [Anaerolineaceae bacterium]
MKYRLWFAMLCLLLASACTAPTPAATPEPTAGPAAEPTALMRSQSTDVFCPTENEAAREAYNSAQNLDKQKKFAEAEVLYRKAIELDSRYCDAMDNLGLIMRRQNKLDEAIDWYKKSLEIMPENTVAMQNMANAYRLQGQNDQAMAWFEKLIRTDADNPEGYFGMGTLHFELGNPEKALTALLEAEKLYKQASSPYVMDAQLYIGLSYFTLQDCGKAMPYLAQVYSEFSTQGGINYAMGLCYLTATTPDAKLAREYITKAQQAGFTVPEDVLKTLETAP